MALSEDMILFAGGMASNVLKDLDTVDMYTVSTDTYTPLSPMPQGNSCPTLGYFVDLGTLTGMAVAVGQCCQVFFREPMFKALSRRVSVHPDRGQQGLLPRAESCHRVVVSLRPALPHQQPQYGVPEHRRDGLEVLWRLRKQ